MAYDEGVAERLRDTYRSIPGVIEKKMFGGIAFMVDGHMSRCRRSKAHTP